VQPCRLGAAVNMCVLHVCCCLPRLHMSTVADILVDVAAAEPHAVRALCNALPCRRELERPHFSPTRAPLARALAVLTASGRAKQWPPDNCDSSSSIGCTSCRCSPPHINGQPRARAHTHTHTHPVAGSHRPVRVEWMRSACCAALLCATR
jgi:hypothetical protein